MNLNFSFSAQIDPVEMRYYRFQKPRSSVFEQLGLSEKKPLYGVDLNSPALCGGPGVPQRVSTIFARFRSEFEQFFKEYDKALDWKEMIGKVRHTLVPLVGQWKSAIVEDMRSLSDQDVVREYGMEYLALAAKTGHFSLARLDKIQGVDFRKENEKLPFSELIKKRDVKDLLEYFSVGELKNKFQSEFKWEITQIVFPFQKMSSPDLARIAILKKIGPEFLLSRVGRNIVDYNLFRRDFGFFHIAYSDRKLEYIDLNGNTVRCSFKKNQFSFERFKFLQKEESNW